MAFNHGINTYTDGTNFVSTKQTVGGVPFFIGAWPCHGADGFRGSPQVINSFDEARRIGGYSEKWRNEDGTPRWNLCQAAFSHFNIFGIRPAVFYNVYNPATHKEAVAETAYDVIEHTVTLDEDAIIDAELTVKAGETPVPDTNYDLSYDGGKLIIELKPDTASYSAVTLNIAYNKAKPEAITQTEIVAAIEQIENCKSALGIVPDIICIPGWSKLPAVAAAMAAKAGNIGGLYRARAVVDLDTAQAAEYSDVLLYKNTNGYTDEREIVCWPLYKVGGHKFDASTIISGLIAETDESNDGVPYESPSNKRLPITALVNEADEEINLTLQQADALSYTDGVVTAISFDGWRSWGNYLGDAQHFICCERMSDFLCNRFVDMFFDYIDRPLSRPLIDAIVNAFNAFLAGLSHDGKLLGGEMEYVGDNNPQPDLLAGRFRLDSSHASPVPAQRIDVHMEFDPAILTAALNV